MARGLFVGLIAIDIFNIVHNHPAANQKIRAQRQFACAGGPAANAAVAFAAFGNEAHLCSGLGSHPTAALAAADLRKHGVTLHDYSDNPDQLPVLSSIMIDSTNGDRCVVYSNPYERKLIADHRYADLIAGHSVILFDGYHLEQALVIAKTAKAGGITTVLDGGSWKDGLEKLLPFIDYAICSADFAPPGCSSPQQHFSYLMDLGVTGCAISRGSEPTVLSIAGEVRQCPVPPTDAVDTLGAGDILHGAFCHFIRNHPFADSIEQAIQAASLSCRFYGTREWIDYL